jgi:hypothetical protein
MQRSVIRGIHAKPYPGFHYIPSGLRVLWGPNQSGLRADSRFKDILRDLALVDYWHSTGNWGTSANRLAPRISSVVDITKAQSERLLPP